MQLCDESIKSPSIFQLFKKGLTMAQFKAFAPNVEVNGETILSVMDGMGVTKELAYRFLDEQGIKDPKPGQWYSQQAWLNAFRMIAEKIGPATLLAIGKTIPENAKWPPNVNTIEKALASIDVAYHLNHRGGEIGQYRFQATGPKSGKVICHNPYPSEFDRGIIVAVARKFAPKGTFPTVKLDETAPTRNKGADECTFLVAW
jgi:hypothetical protein